MASGIVLNALVIYTNGFCKSALDFLMDTRIQEVWSGNLESEMAAIRGIIDLYPYVAMVSISDTGH